jgi:hypothetical protein
MQNVATGLYAAASSSGSIFFALNFGDEGRKMQSLEKIENWLIESR